MAQPTKQCGVKPLYLEGPACCPGAPADIGQWQDYGEDELAEAKLLLAEEAMIVRSAMDHGSVSQEEYAEALSVATRDFIYLAASKRYGRSASATNTDRLESIKVSPHPRPF